MQFSTFDLEEGDKEAASNIGGNKYKAKAAYALLNQA